MVQRVHRRGFLQQGVFAGATVLGAGMWLGGERAESKSPNEKLNLGVIGTANRAGANIAGVQGENIAALCDVDETFLGAASVKFPAATTYHDFRKLLDQKDLDAIVVSTPDHLHAHISIDAMRRGKHVYCEKPLAHSVQEARLVAETAAKHKVVTQMGTQIHAENNYRRVVEAVQAGVIGPVRECHVWCNRTWGGENRPQDKPPVPSSLHWDLWLGPAPERPYHAEYHPKKWRAWWDFGNGTLGDMGCHYLDLAFWALKLRHPTHVAADGPPVHAESTPVWLAATWQFPARGEMPPVKLVWYDGGKQPRLTEEAGIANWKNGVLFVGDKGMLVADYAKHKLLPETTFAGYQPPPQTIPVSIGHHAEWIAACKTGGPTTCSFDYAGALTETVLLGNVAYRSGKPLAWDAARLKADAPSAEQYLRREYRRGWELPS